MCITQRRLAWDAAKHRANQTKHGIDFATAARVFADQTWSSMRTGPTTVASGAGAPWGGPEEFSPCWSSFTFTGRRKMAKKPSASSRPEKLVSVKAESIFNKPLTQGQRGALDRLAAMPESEIDFSDIPPLSDEQLASAFRPRSKELVAVRLDRDVLTWLKGYGRGYSTRINAILRAAMTARRPA
jgi:uncharacterized protein (DUF4415 family)